MITTIRQISIEITEHRGWMRVRGPSFPGSFRHVYLGYIVKTDHGYAFEDASGYRLRIREQTPEALVGHIRRHYNL